MRQRSISLLLATMRASIQTAKMSATASAASSGAARSSPSFSASAAAAKFLRRPLLSLGGRPRPYGTTRPGAISIASPLSVRASADSRRSLAAEAAAVSFRLSLLKHLPMLPLFLRACSLHALSECPGSLSHAPNCRALGANLTCSSDRDQDMTRIGPAVPR